jgi:hypothetical protein
MSLMGLGDLLRRKNSTDSIIENLEQEMAFALTQAVDDNEESEASASALEADTEVVSLPMPIEQPEEPILQDILSSHAQQRLATFKVFDEANRSARDELTKIGKAFTNVVNSYNLGRDFIAECEEEIIRASHLENANTRLTAENRRLTERLEKLERLRERQDDVIQAMRRREARLLAEADTQRDNTAELRMQVVEMRNLAASAEAARGEMHLQLATRAAELDRLQRDHDALREKDQSNGAELEANLKRHAELRRKLEDIQTAQNQDANRASELTNKALMQEIEIQRLQRQIDLSETQLSEVNDARRAAEQEVRDSERRYQAEISAIRAELEQWKASIQLAKDDGLIEATPPAAEVVEDNGGDASEENEPIAEVSTPPARNGASPRAIRRRSIAAGRVAAE